MKCLLLIVLIKMSLSATYTHPADTLTTSRSTPTFGEIIKTLDINSTTLDVLDVRTPPKIKRQQDKLKQEVHYENSHLGIAIPLEENSLATMHQTTKKLPFYKLEKPTTDSGLSTWILLNSQTTTTTSSPNNLSLRPTAEIKTEKNQSFVFTGTTHHKLIKPVLKKKITHTDKTTTTTTHTTTGKTSPVSEISFSVELKSHNISRLKNTVPIIADTNGKAQPVKLTKIMASVLNNALDTRKINSSMETTKKVLPANDTRTKLPSVTSTTEKAIVKIGSKTRNETITSSKLPLEAKEGSTDLSDTEKRKKTTKRKKNKNRRRKPVTKKTDSSLTGLNEVKLPPNKPISTQLYNYLSREIMPTVSVGLAGLMVAAGIASYFFYPSAITRRIIDTERKDEGKLYLYDEYSGEIPEEEAIGKVIAGMPESFLRGPVSRNTFFNNKVEQSEPTTYQSQSFGSSSENLQLASVHEKVSDNTQNKYGSKNQRFVVGSKPNQVIEEMTPASVPEHGPRSINLKGGRMFYVSNMPKQYSEPKIEIENGTMPEYFRK